MATPDYHQVRTLYRGPLLKVFDVCCRAECRTCSAEEPASGHLLVLPRAGVFVQHRSRREEIVADPTRLLFFNRGEPCQFAHPIPGGDDCTALAFEEDALRQFLLANDPAAEAQAIHRPFSRPTASATPRTALLLQRLRQHLLFGETVDPLAVEQTAAGLLGRALQAAEGWPAERPRRAETRRAHRELAHRTRLTIAASYRQKVTLSGLARQVFSSPFHLARVFRRETGRSVHAYVLHLRLQAALEQVAHDPAVDLTALALDLGFASHAHLSDTFRRRFGIAPSGMRHRAPAALLALLRQRLPA